MRAKILAGDCDKCGCPLQKHTHDNIEFYKEKRETAEYISLAAAVSNSKLKQDD